MLTSLPKFLSLIASRVPQTSVAILVDHFIRFTKQIEAEEAVRKEKEMLMAVHNTLVRA